MVRKTGLVMMLAAAMVLSGAALVQAAETGAKSPAGEKAAAKSDGKVAATAEKAPAGTAEKTAPAGLTPVEKKMGDIQKVLDAADKLKTKVPDVESKVNAKIAELKQSGKPIEESKIRKELDTGKSVSSTAKSYAKIVLELAAFQEQICGKYKEACGMTADLEKMAAKDEANKTKADALIASIKEKYIESLKKVAGMYERAGDQDQTVGAYKRILAVDKNNTAALQYFKEQENKAKEAAADKKKDDKKDEKKKR